MEQVAVEPIPSTLTTLPTVTVAELTGLAWSKALSAGKPVVITTYEELEWFENPHAHTISRFSSWGPSSDLVFKPDLAAPGNLIYTTRPLNLGSYGISSGTSLASPFIAGCFSLLKQHDPMLTPHDLMMNAVSSATPIWIPYKLTLPKSPYAFAYSPAQQGGGLVNVTRMFDNLIIRVNTTLSVYDLTRDQRPGQVPRLVFDHSVRNLSKNILKRTRGVLLAPAVTSFKADGTLVSPPISQILNYATFGNKVKATLAPNEDFVGQAGISSSTIPLDRFWVVGGFIEHSLQAPDGTEYRYNLPFSGMMGRLTQIPILPPVTSPYYPGLFNATTGAIQFNVNKMLVQIGRLNHSTADNYTFYDIPGGLLVDQSQNFGGDVASYITWSGSMLEPKNGPVGATVTVAAGPGQYRLRIRWAQPQAAFINDKDTYTTYTSDPFLIVASQLQTDTSRR
ncbi:hypothetical protein IWQ60_010271 [Tieghemiomyces parasiticus]|uniref:Peptidase S8/S53 domain-containing protein n=1 Tax=Tieghemiomyces parasiticus TaxID=78921 RepID=A0A9W8DIN2_9FUNG|nr:hypothetical protein IWQ60_010271 [Tieghemiomyces parasiticus]